MVLGTDIPDQLLAGRDPQEVFRPDGFVDELKKALPERIVDTGLDAHPGGGWQEGGTDRRNGGSPQALDSTLCRAAGLSRGHFPMTK